MRQGSPVRASPVRPQPPYTLPQALPLLGSHAPHSQIPERYSPTLAMLSCLTRASSIQEAAGTERDNPGSGVHVHMTRNIYQYVKCYEWASTDHSVDPLVQEAAAVKQEKCCLSPIPYIMSPQQEHCHPAWHCSPSCARLATSSTYHRAVVPQAIGRA